MRSFPAFFQRGILVKGIFIFAPYVCCRRGSKSKFVNVLYKDVATLVSRPHKVAVVMALSIWKKCIAEHKLFTM